MKRNILSGILVAIFGLLFCAFCPCASAQSSGDLSPFLGRWQLNPSLTKMERFGPNGKNLVRDPTFTFVFSAAKRGLDLAIYEKYPQPAPTRIMPLVPDQKPHPCENKDGACLTVGGNADEQTYAYYRIDSHMLVRIFYIKGQISEYTSYAISSDDKVFTLITWSAETPQYQNIQVFDKQP